MITDNIRSSGEAQNLQPEANQSTSKINSGSILGRIATALKFVAKKVLLSIDKILTFVSSLWLYSLESIAEKIDTKEDPKYSNFIRHLSRFSISVIGIIAYPAIRYLDATENWKD